MDNSVKKTLAILNLTGSLSPELTSYFASKKILVVDPLETDDVLDWTHILTKDIADYSLIASTYETIEKDIKIISLSSIYDLQNFILANGKLTFDELWLRNTLGTFILDKFFQEYGGITLGDNYPSFQEQGSFNITNPFNTGEYLDRLIHHAFAGGASALSIKTFFDHLVMYLAGLKNKDKVGFPIEVTYGKYDDVFALQLHFFTQNLTLDDVTSSLSSTISKKAEEYLLNIAVQSADFFDFTSLGQVNKSVITALWTKDERITYENKGLMFTHLSSASALSSYPTSGVTSHMSEEPVLDDLSSKIVLPEIALVEVEVTKISGESFNETLAEKISSTMEMDKIKQILSGNLEDEAFAQLVKGVQAEEPEPRVVKSANSEDLKIKIGSKDTLDDIVQIVKGRFDQEKEVFKVKGQKFDVDNFAFRVTSGLNEKIKGDDVLKTQVLSQQLPDTIKKGFFDFALKLNKLPDDLTEADIEAFQNFEIPKLIKVHAELDEANVLSELTKDGQSTAKSFLKDFKQDFEEILKTEFQEDSLDKILESIQTTEDNDKVRDVLKETLKKSLEEKFHLSEKNSISTKEQDVLVKALTTSLAEDETKIRTIVTEEKTESREDVSALFSNVSAAIDPKIEQKLTFLKNENEKLKSKINAMIVEAKSSRATKNQIADIEAKAQEVAGQAEVVSALDKDEALRKQFSEKLLSQKAINAQDAKQLSELLERESVMLNDVKQEEIKTKRLLIEAHQKETFFATELEKSQRQLRSKELVITKSKETISKLIERGEYERREWQQKIDNVNKALASSQASGHATIIRDLEKKNANLEKMIEMHKNKISDMATTIQKQSAKNDDSAMKDDIRKLQLANAQYAHKIESNKKEVSHMQERSIQDLNLIKSLRSEKTRLEQLLKQATHEATKTQTSAAAPNPHEQDLKRAQTQVQMLETQLKESLSKLREYEKKLQEAMMSQKRDGGGEDNSKVKVTQLETSLKKITHDLVESRNQLAEMKKETNKLRQDKIALQNQLDKNKKDSAKAAQSAATPKSSGGNAGGKAA